MKRILFLTAYPPTNVTAGQNYTRMLLEDISSSNIVDVIYWDFQGHSEMVSHKVNTIESIKLNSFTKMLRSVVYFYLFPLFTVRFSLKKLLDIRRISDNYDVIYFDFSQVFMYSLFIKHPCKIMMCHDVISQKYSRRRCSSIYNWFVIFSEKLLLSTAKYCFTFSNKDSMFLQKKLGINSSPVSFYIADEIKNIDVLDLELSDNFIMYGAWNRPENYDGLLWFLREVMPHISIKITIIGGGMPENIRTILGTLNVKYLGFVENPYIHISESRGLIAPLFQGAGVKVKVIESLALGTPVVGTEVAFEGIPNLISRNAMIRCESSEDFIRSLNSFSTSVIEKHEIQKEFNERYSNAKFKNFLNTL